MVNNITVQTELTILKVAILAAAWEEGEKDPEWVKRDGSGRFSKKNGSGEEGDSSEDKERSLSQKAKNLGKAAGDSINKVLEKVGLRKSLEQETAGILKKLSKPDSLSTPEKQKELLADVERTYKKFMKAYEDSPVETKAVIGVLFGISSTIAAGHTLHSLHAIGKGAKQISEAGKSIIRVNSLISGSLKKSMKNDAFVDFYKELFKATNDAGSGGKEAFEALSKVEIAAEATAKKISSHEARISRIESRILDRLDEDPDFVGTAEHSEYIDTLKAVKDNLSGFVSQSKQLKENTQQIKEQMYSLAKKNAAKTGASKEAKDFLAVLDEYVANMAKETKEFEFGKGAAQVGTGMKSTEKNLRDSAQGAGKMLWAIPGLLWSFHEAYLGSEIAAEVIEDAWEQYSKEK